MTALTTVQDHACACSHAMPPSRRVELRKASSSSAALLRPAHVALGLRLDRRVVSTWITDVRRGAHGRSHRSKQSRTCTSSARSKPHNCCGACPALGCSAGVHRPSRHYQRLLVDSESHTTSRLGARRVRPSGFADDIVTSPHDGDKRRALAARHRGFTELRTAR